MAGLQTFAQKKKWAKTHRITQSEDPSKKMNYTVEVGFRQGGTAVGY